MVQKAKAVETESLIREVARRCHATPEEVEREIAEAIEAAYTNPNKSTDVTAAHEALPRKGKIPTVDEFLRHMIGQMIITAK